MLEGKIALVTGGSTGIGRATVDALADAGARLVIGNRNAELGESLVDELTQRSVDAVFLRTDVTDSDQVKALVDLAVERFGRLDVAFNNAGVDGEQQPLHEQSERSVEQLLEVNIKGVYYGIKHQAAAMLNNPGGPSGSIVNAAPGKVESLAAKSPVSISRS